MISLNNKQTWSNSENLISIFNSKFKFFDLLYLDWSDLPYQCVLSSTKIWESFHAQLNSFQIRYSYIAVLNELFK